jgi:hypothetical protein
MTKRSTKTKPKRSKPKRRRVVVPREVLEEIAGNKRAPAHARVAAAKALMALDKPLGGDAPADRDRAPGEAPADAGADALTRRALAIMDRTSNRRLN